MKEYWILLGTMLGACALGAGIIALAFLPLVYVVSVLSLVVAGLVWKLWTYRAAIIRLQADMTLVLNELTRPVVGPQTMRCARCENVMTPTVYAHHRCQSVQMRVAR